MDRFTVDDLFDLPDWGVHSEVLDGRLLLAPPPTRRHQRVVGRLYDRFRLVLPGGVQARSQDPVRLVSGDGPVPDVLVTSGVDWPRGWPVGQVHTVVEVVAGDGRQLDRVWKRDLYRAAGIPCYWRVELTGQSWVQGPLPMVVVRLRDRDGWRDILAGAGRLHDLPVAYGRDRGGSAVTVPVRLDPATLLSRSASSR